MTVNVENINKVIETIRGLKPERFDMNVWAETRGGWFASPERLLTECGTCGCIGGWTNALFDGCGRADARDALGLTHEEANALFYPYGLGGPDGQWRITRRQAIRVLEHLRDTGEVDWSKRGRR